MTMFGIKAGATLLRYLPDGSMETVKWTSGDTPISIISKSENYADWQFTFVIQGIEYIISMDDCIKTGDPVPWP